MKIAAFNGSPREGGNTEYLLRSLLDAAEAEGIKSELIQVGGSGLQGCTACMQCRINQDRECALHGDQFNQWFAEMVDAYDNSISHISHHADELSQKKEHRFCRKA